ncbi:hypothetical protein E1I69_19150 [Bacillus timonensis]|uniref:Uncharacterized protein n=1 Tax=Bacillus timonensis TaxID=1033734 RepID=A0A4V3V7A9_9BACI|nr:hypothetical protein [Bacillus timonensis]THE10333.1 hypothetical protein E1I69_19150 [Bacillus timonensis]
MELQTKDNRNFTNQLPKWAIGCHFGLISIFFLLGIVLFVFGVNELSEMGLGFSLLLFAIGAVSLGFSWFSYKNVRKYLDIIFNIQLGENGYDSYTRDKKKNEEEHIFLPYEKIKYVLIGMDYRLKAKSKIHSGENYQMRTKFVPVRSAKVIIYGVDANNQVKVTSFPHADQQSLFDWIDVFQKNGVEILHTDKALTATPRHPDVLESIPKKRFDGTLSFVMGSEADGLDNIFLTEKQQEVLEEKNKKNRKNGFLFTALLSFLQLFMVCFWFPHWDIVEDSFGDNSGEFFALFFTVLLQFFIYLKMGRVKWFEPIRDMFILCIGILLGVLVSPDERTTFPQAVQSYAIMTIGAFLFLYYGMKVYSWFQRLWKTNKREDTHF